MLPLMLDPARLRLALLGDGPAALRRLDLLLAGGARELAVYAPAADAALATAAGPRLFRRWPSPRELAHAQLVFIAGAPAAKAAELAAAVRAAGTILHVEDTPGLGDLQMPAVLRRGELTIAVSTAGGSPALAAHIRRFLGGIFGPEWRGRLAELSERRRRWRGAGMDHATLIARTETLIARRKWLPVDATAGIAASAAGTQDSK